MASGAGVNAGSELLFQLEGHIEQLRSWQRLRQLGVIRVQLCLLVRQVSEVASLKTNYTIHFIPFHAFYLT